MQISRRTARNKNRQSGNTIVEFALVAVFFLIPVFFGSVGVGLLLTTGIQTWQVTRDAAHMFSRGVDFSQPLGQNIIAELAKGTGFAAPVTPPAAPVLVTGGNGNVIFSKVMYVYDVDCLAGGLTIATCTNRNHYVIKYRVVIGNPGVQASSLGGGSVVTNPDGTVKNYLTDPAAKVANEATYSSPDATPASPPLPAVPMVQGISDYWTEGNLAAPNIAFLGFPSTPLCSARLIFAAL